MFEYLIEDFKTYKPLLSAVKHEYEMMLVHQREMIRDLEPLKVTGWCSRYAQGVILQSDPYPFTPLVPVLPGKVLCDKPFNYVLPTLLLTPSRRGSTPYDVPHRKATPTKGVFLCWRNISVVPFLLQVFGNKRLGITHESSSRMHGELFQWKGYRFQYFERYDLMTGAGIFFKERYMSMKGQSLLSNKSIWLGFSTSGWSLLPCPPPPSPR